MNRSNCSVWKNKWLAFLAVLIACLVVAASPEPSDVGNAALLYYQAFILCPDASVSDIPTEILRSVLEEPNVPEEVGEYVRKYRYVIEMTTLASRVRQCDWGADGFVKAPVGAVLARRSRYAAFLVCCDARILALEGDYLGALESCLVVRRLAEDLSNATVILPTDPISVDAYALECIQQILGLMPADERMLTFLQEQLVSIPLVSDVLWRNVDRGFERHLQCLRVQADRSSQAGQQLSQDDSGNRDWTDKLPRGDSDLPLAMKEPFAAFLRSVRDTLAKNLPYEQAYTTIEKLANEFRRDALAKPTIIPTLYMPPDRVPALYNLQLSHRSHFNAILAAIEIYRANARTGQLPQHLGDGILGDPYSGEGFEYERTAEGFVLRGRVIPTDRSTPWEYHFQVLQEAR